MTQTTGMIAIVLLISYSLPFFPEDILPNST